MKKLVLAAVAVGMAGAAHAGIEAAYTPITSADEGGSAEPALILLALIGLVIASAGMGGMATRDKTTMIPDEPEDL